VIIASVVFLIRFYTTIKMIFLSICSRLNATESQAYYFKKGKINLMVNLTTSITIIFKLAIINP
jgi:hypothetical protein